MKTRILSNIIATLLVGIVLGGLISVSFIFDEQTVLENSRAFFAAFWR